MGTGGSFPGGKTAGMWSWPLTSIQSRVQECMELHLHSPNKYSWRGAQLSTGTTLINCEILYKQAKNPHLLVLIPLNYTFVSLNSSSLTDLEVKWNSPCNVS
jgi:hypothetical protein